MTGVRNLGLPLGNPLALPREGAATAGAVSSGKYDLLLVGSVNRPSQPSIINEVSHIILMNGRGCFFTRQNPSSNFQTTFDYSSSGISNLTTVSNNFTLPLVGGNIGILTRNGRFIWSHPVSPTQTLFHYGHSDSGGGLFLVTWDGTGSPISTTPTLPANFLKNRGGRGGKLGSDCFILEDGTLGVLASNSTSGIIALHIYTQTLTFVRTINLFSVSTAFAGDAAIKIRKTSYGYIVAAFTPTSTNISGRVATLNSTCTSLLSVSQEKIMLGTASQASSGAGVVLGEEGAIITSVVNSLGVVSSLVFPVSSGGIITNAIDSSNQTSATASFLLNAAAEPERSLLDAIFQGSCCSKFADRNSSYAFVATGRTASTFFGGGYSYSSSGQSLRTEYSDMIVTPFICRFDDPDIVGRRTAQIETDVKAVQSFNSVNSEVFDLSAEDPEGGFVLLGKNIPNRPLQLFEKVFR